MKRIKGLSVRGAMPFKARTFLLLLTIFVAVAGCTAQTLHSVIADITSGKNSSAHLIKDVPVFVQGDKLCGPAALTTVINFHGVDVTQQQIADKVFTEKAQGTFTLDMLLYAKDVEGLRATHYSGGLTDVKQRVREGNPPVLFLKSRMMRFPKGHYVVVTGFSDTYKVVILHDGGQKQTLMSYNRLLAAWKKTAYSTLLVTKEQ